MAKPRSNAELIHRFCNGYREHVTVGNMSIAGNTIFSYRLPIGRYVGSTLLIHSASNSNTTNQHVSKLWNAAHGRIIRPQCISSAKANYDQVKALLPEILLLASRARLRKSSYLARATSLMEAANEFTELEGGAPLFDIAKELGKDLTEIAAIARAEAKKRRLEEAARAAKVLADNLAAIEAWKAGVLTNLDWKVRDNVEPQLRVAGNAIQTSRGAEIPLEVAPTLWKMILRAKAKHNDYTPGFKLGHYTLTKISSAGDITVGCHHIKFDELNRIAGLLGLQDVAA
jgi:hypothetical protein